MKISIDTPSYNEKRYGRPYIAVIDFSNDPKGAPVWGSWIGTHGYTGILQIDAACGDVLMRGQKDNRGNNGTPTYGFVEADTTVTWGLDKAEAYKKWDDFEQGVGITPVSILMEERANLLERLAFIDAELAKLQASAD
jgi:hypothetical protein